MKKETIALYIKGEGILDIEKIIQCYNSYIYKMLKNSISNESDIEEILADVFIIFWNNYKRLDNNTEIKPYLIGITKNLIKKKYREYSITNQNIELGEETIVESINIEELSENEEKSQIISNTLENIKHIDRKVFLMFYYNQKKIREIANTLKISEAKVKVILYRTRKLIKKNLKERGYNYGK